VRPDGRAGRGPRRAAGALDAGRGGTVGNIDHWGKRRFAYEIRHLEEGYYTVVDLEAEPETVDELSRVLFLADNVIRHKVIRPQAA
jgi:small subunit ribosomal protein S6